MLNGCSTFAILGLRWQSLEITQMEKKNIWILAQKICCQHSRLHYQQQDFFVAIFKKKVFENHQKKYQFATTWAKIFEFSREKNLHIYRQNSSQFSFCNLHGVFFLRNIFWVVYSIFWFSLLLRCFSPFIFCCHSIKKGPPLHTVSIKMRFYSECTDHIYDGNASRAV